MKRKSLILLASTVLGLGLVGGTLAAWAVTDNADPLGIKVSPGNVETANIDYVTLNWGEQKSLSNVGNLKLGSKRLAGVLDVRQSNATLTFPGRLSYKITGDSALIDVLHIDVYTGTFSGRTPGADLVAADFDGKSTVEFTVADPAISTETKGYDFNALANNQANLFSVVVYLDSGVDADDYAALASTSVDISFDWGHGSEVVPVTTQTLYLKSNDLGSAPKAYAWKADGSARNAAYPGALMTKVRTGYYSIEVDITKYDKIIFNNGTEDGLKSGDIVIADSFIEDSDNPGTYFNMFVYDGSVGVGGTFSTYADEDVAKKYYLVGENLSYNSKAVSWNTSNDTLLTITEGSVNFDVTTDGNARLKIYESTENSWISNDGNDFTLGDAGTYHMTFTVSPLDGVTYISAVKA